MNDTQVQKATNIINGVLIAANSVLAVLGEAGVGGHLNESQTAKMITEFGSLATIAINAFHDAQGIPITPESVLALLPADFALLPPDAPALTTPVIESTGEIVEKTVAVEPVVEKTADVSPETPTVEPAATEPVPE